MIIGYIKFDEEILEFKYGKLPPDLKKYFKEPKEDTHMDSMETDENIKTLKNLEPIGYILKTGRRRVDIYEKDISIRFRDVPLDLLIQRAQESKDRINPQNNTVTNLWAHDKVKKTEQDKDCAKKRVIDFVKIPKSGKFECIYFEDLLSDKRVCIGYTKKPTGCVEPEYLEDLSSFYTEILPNPTVEHPILADLELICRDIFHLDLLINCCCYPCKCLITGCQRRNIHPAEEEVVVVNMDNIQIGSQSMPEEHDSVEYDSETNQPIHGKFDREDNPYTRSLFPLPNKRR